MFIGVSNNVGDVNVNKVKGHIDSKKIHHKLLKSKMYVVDDHRSIGSYFLAFFTCSILSNNDSKFLLMFSKFFSNFCLVCCNSV